MLGEPQVRGQATPQLLDFSHAPVFLYNRRLP
jgi:hypothetical protein